MRHGLVVALVLALAGIAVAAQGPGVFVRVKLIEPKVEQVRVTLNGFRHAGDPWHFPDVTVRAKGGEWTEWVDLSAWPWHGRVNREGGLAEWAAMRVTADLGGVAEAGCRIRVELAERPEAAGAVHAFEERSGSRSIAFLVPTPLREKAGEFETGAQMTNRHLAWAKQAAGENAPRPARFDVCTAIWGHYDPALAKTTLQTLRLLGFNVVNHGSGVRGADVREMGFRMYRQEWLYEASPEALTKKWREGTGRRVESNLKEAEGRWEFADGVAHWVLADEIRAVNLKELAPAVRDAAFADWLRSRGVRAEELGPEGGKLAVELLEQATLPREAGLATRKRAFYAGKFGQWWSAQQLRHARGLIRESLPGAKVETLPTDHGFFNAWGPPCIGMSYPLLDLFEVAEQEAVDQLAAEDWMGLNHMYGPASTWTGAQSFEYLCAIMRSAIGERPVLLRGLITPSDDLFLRLKAYSALGQGARSFFFWTYGPTYIGTENYWSDLRSMYDGVADVTKTVARAEEVLMGGRPVRDPVAILYSVSHDFWHTDQPPAFVEKRLLWHALRHAQVQPDFLREEDVARGKLKGYRALYVTDWCVAREASAAIERWVREGGVVYLSAGAATRDEFYEPYAPEFARRAWGEDGASRLKAEKHRYNERVDLPTIKAMAKAAMEVNGDKFSLPVIGCRLDLAEAWRGSSPGGSELGRFEDGAVAGAMYEHGKGRVVAMGFCPMLAYGQLAGFKPTTLEEKWPAEPRRLAELALTAARVAPAAKADRAVVETSLIHGTEGSVLVLVNYTYEPIAALAVTVKLDRPVRSATSLAGNAVKVEPAPGGVRLTLPLETTDLILLK